LAEVFNAMKWLPILKRKQVPLIPVERRLILNVYTRARYLKENKNWRSGNVVHLVADLIGIGRTSVRSCVADFVDADLTIEPSKPVAKNAATAELNESY
jgi:hypothetical protein